MNNNKQNNIPTYSYFQLPRKLFEHPEYRTISIEAKLLFALIFDRLKVSAVNSDKYTDERGNVYALYTFDEIKSKFGISNNKTSKIIKELVSVGLIEKYSVRLGEPNRFLLTDKAKSIMNFDNGVYHNRNRNNTTTQNEDDLYPNDSQPNINNADDRLSYGESNYNNNIYNNLSYNNQSISYEEAIEEIKEQIEYDCINGDPEIVAEIIMIMYDVIYGTASTVRIGANIYPRSAVVARHRMLEAEHIDNVIYSLENTTTKITNVKAFLITALYNEPATANSSVAADFSYHFKHGNPKS